MARKKPNQKIRYDKKYRVVFFTTFKEAKSSKEDFSKLCADCHQLNICIEEEGNMDDEDLLSIDPKIKVFAGEAWTLIHKRRVEDGWYDQLHEL